MRFQPESSPKKSLGQHFIWDEKTLIRITDAAELKENETVLEIGAGFGNLTKHIIARVRKVFAVEIDKKLIDLTSEYIRNNEKVELICADILKIDWTRFFGGEKKIVVVGNIPYYITSPIIEKLIEYRKNIDRAVLLVQKELAERIASTEGTKRYSSISVFCQTFSKVELLFVVPASKFKPKPKVDSRLIRLRLHEKPLFEIPSEREFKRVVRTFFCERRKTIFNAIVRCGLSKENADKILRNLNLAKNLRPEDLSPETLAKISMEIKQLSLTKGMESE